jgi:hypothetical protein
MKKFNRKEAEQLVKTICEQQINNFGNVLYKSLTDPTIEVGPAHVYNFCKYINSKLYIHFEKPNLNRNNGYTNFTLTSNLMTLIQKYGIKIDIVDSNGTVINSNNIPDITLFYKYGICRPNFVDSIETYLEYKNSK